MPEIINDHVTFWIAQREVCPSTGRLHLQGYMEFDIPLSLNVVKGIINAHWSPRIGTQEQNIAYCSKEESRDNKTKIDDELVDAGPWRSDDTNKDLAPYEQGYRSDISSLCNEIKNGASNYDIAQIMPEMLIKYSKGISVLRESCIEPAPLWRNISVFVIWGKTGIGKSRAARVIDTELWSLWCPTGQWWDGYAGENTLLIDEFTGDIPITLMNNLLDGYRLTLNVKGSTTKAKWTTVIICSNSSPESWYRNESIDLRDAFLRRITKSKGFGSSMITRDDIKELITIPDKKSSTVTTTSTTPLHIELPSNNEVERTATYQKVTDNDIDELLNSFENM